MNSKSRTSQPATFRRTLLSAVVAGCFGVGAALGQPVGPQVINGSVNFATQGNSLNITNTPNAIINWQGFSIAPNEVTRFIQQNGSSNVLNRVVGLESSAILGALQSNGRVYLINPNGILFGPNARVDVNGLIASTLDISNQDFLAGKYKFNAGRMAGKVDNQGAITTPSGGQIVLVAPDVQNSGIITSPQGEILLAAGKSVHLVDTASPDLAVVVSAPENRALNLGQIIANSGKVGIYGALVNQRGKVNADSAVVGENGKIVFKASKDTLLEAGSVTSATGAGKGGEIQVLGERVGLTGNARVDASGQQGGGTVLVGGDYQGKSPAVQNAQVTYFGPDARIKADAIGSGDGGKVIVWSDDTTRAYGSISARGGEQGGNGGFVETSGKKHLAFNANIDVSAPKGKVGAILLDPQDIIIADGSAGANDAMLADNILNAAEPDTTTDVTVSEQALEGLSGNVTLLASRDIILNNLADNLLNMTGVGTGSTLALTAGQHITATLDVNDRFQTNGGAISFTTSGGNINIGGVKSLGGNVTMNASGTMTVREVVSQPGGGPPYNGGNINLTSGGLMSLGGGHVDARQLGGGTDGNVTFNSGGEIIMQTAKTIFANQLKMTAVGGITDGAAGPVSTQVATLNNISNTGSGNIKISNTGNLTFGDVGSLGYGVNQQAGSGTVSINTAATNTLGVFAPVIAQGGPVTLSGPGGVTFVAYTAGSPNAGGGVFSYGGAVTVTAADAGAAISMPASSLINSGGGAVSLVANNMAFTSSSITAGAGNVSLNLANTALAISLGSGATDVASTTLGLSEAELKTVTTSGMLMIGAAGNVGAMTLAGALDLTSGSGLTGALTLDAGIPGFSVSSPIHTAYGLNISTGGTLINTAANTAGGEVFLKADKMDLAGGTINAGSVGLLPKTGGNAIAIHVGTAAATDLTASTLELSNAELNTITAGTLRIGDANSGAIDIKTPLMKTAGGALTNVSAALNLTSGGAITQQAGATIDVLPGLNVSGASVNLTQPNPVGAISGSTSGGDFIYHSLNQVTVGQVDGVSGITVPANYSIKLESDSSSGINQQAGKTISTSGGTGGLALKTIGPVYLPEANNIKKVAADLASNSGTGSFRLHSTNDLGIGSVLSVTGITTNNTDITLSAAANKQMTVNFPIATGAAGRVSLEADLLDFVDTVTAGDVDIRPYTAGRNITVGSATCGAGPCLNVTNLWKVDAPTIGIGNDVTNASGAVYVAAITTGGATVADRHANTTRIGLFSGAGVTQHLTNTTPNAINVQDLGVGAGGAVILGNTANAVTNLAGKTTGQNFTFVDSTGFNVALMSGGIAPYAYSMSGISTGGGNVSLTASTGDLNIPAQINAGAGTVSLNSVTGSVYGSATSPDIIAGVLDILAFNNIWGANGLHTQVPRIGQLVATNGYIDVLSFGGVILGPATANPATVVSAASNITVTALSPITVNGGLASSTGNVSLTASSGGTLTVNAPVTAAGTIAFAGGALAGSQTVPSATFSNNTPAGGGGGGGGAAAPPPPPTLDQCAANPTAAGCSAILPPLAQCAADPTAAGCSAVLPTLGQCATDPTAAGCSAVLPPLAQCAADPTTAGCSAVLPTLGQCATDPTAAGCSAVLPPLAQCALTPTAAGCSAVLPTLSQCATDPTAAGCSAVLPPLAQCALTPTAAGCSVVLPTLSQCAVNPTAAGCSAVLPPLAQCALTPTAAGCSAVLPTLGQCATDPAAAGCSAVLPTLSQCATSPTAVGCSAVLPNLDQCAANSALAGCSTVLPAKLPDLAKDNKDSTKSLDQALNQTNSTLNSATLGSVVKPLATSPLLLASKNNVSLAPKDNTPPQAPASEGKAAGGGAGETPGRSAGSESRNDNPDSAPAKGEKASDDKKTDDKKDEKKDDKKDDKKKDTVAQKEDKKDDAPKKKQYCN